MPGVPVDLWWLHSCATNTLHTRLRVQRAPGIPHALQRGERFMHNSGAARREVRTRVCSWGRHCAERLVRRSSMSEGGSDEAIHTFFAAMDCFAEPVIGRAFARPVGSQ